MKGSARVPAIQAPCINAPKSERFVFNRLQTLCANQSSRISFNSFLLNRLRTLARKTGGVTLLQFSPFVFSTTYARHCFSRPESFGCEPSLVYNPKFVQQPRSPEEGEVGNGSI